jgi:hypothetical protein
MAMTKEQLAGTIAALVTITAGIALGGGAWINAGNRATPSGAPPLTSSAPSVRPQALTVRNMACEGVSHPLPDDAAIVGRQQRSNPDYRAASIRILCALEGG